ncbi:MAG: ATPase [Pseudomonas sp.]
MRNDALDELEHVPSLTTDARDRDEFGRGQVGESRERQPAYGPSAAPAPRRASTGPLWALLGALLIALGGLGWWSFQQISLMEQQLVATQESFARISEDAAGRLQDISGKVVATESNVTSESEALKLKVKQLESKLAELSKQQQNVAGQQSGQGKRLEQLSSELKTLGAELKTQQGAVGQVDGQLKSLAGEQAALKAAQGDLGKLATQLQALSGELELLKQRQGNPNPAIGRLEQDVLVLKSELENRPASSNSAEFDAFRAQMTRNINALQGQMVNLQEQLDAPR